LEHDPLRSSRILRKPSTEPARALFGVLDGFVRRRLRAILRKQDKRSGIGRCHRDHQRWPNTFFAAHGLFTLCVAHAQARHSR
jgi:RNA-directed DNA polymerase